MSIEVKHHAPIVYKVYEEMKSHVGKSNAISADDLCDKFGVRLFGKFEEVENLKK